MLLPVHPVFYFTQVVLEKIEKEFRNIFRDLDFTCAIVKP